MPLITLPTGYTCFVEDCLYSADELLAMPREARFELIDGQLQPMGMASGDHGFLTSDLSIFLGEFVRDNELGRCFAAGTGVWLASDPDTVLAPDFGYIREERMTYPRGDGFIPIIPDLVIETRSPDVSAAEVAKQLARWRDFGAAVVIDADPESETLTVYQADAAPEVLRRGDTMTLPSLLPGFALPLSQIFDDEWWRK